MNLFASRVVLRPRGLTEVLDLALPLCMANRRLLGALALGALGPLGLLAAGLRLRAHWSWPVVWTVVLLGALVAEGIFTVALGEALFRDPAEVRVALLPGRFARRLAVDLMAHLTRALLVGLLASVPPLLFFGGSGLFVHEAVLLENARVAAAWRRSRALTARHTAFTLGLWAAELLVLPLGAVVTELLGTSIVGPVLQLGEPFGSLFHGGGSAFAVLGLLLAVPLAAAVRFLGYLDLRIRKEGWDIQLRFLSWAEREKARTQVAA